MDMEKMGEWERPERPPKPRDFIPLEEISEEHVSPDWPRPLTPEELLIQEEESVQEDTAFLAREDQKSSLKSRAESPNIEGGDQSFSREDPLPTHEYERIARERAAMSDTSDAVEEPEARKQKFKPEKTRKYGKWGREQEGKHEKGGDSIRGEL